MFHDFYQMLEEPFGVSPDPRFLYLGSSHREALASLFYGIESGRGFMVLIAPPGCGKTTLIHQLVGKVKPTARTVFLFQTQCSSNEMLQYLLNDLGVDVQGMGKVAMHNRLQQILTQEKLAGRRFVLIVDEAQNLESEVLETIRLLSNFETAQQKLVQILLVGQPQLARRLGSPGADQLQQRISICARLQPFKAEETAGYIEHRLKVAGYPGGELFSPGAMTFLKEHSRGVPRNINRLCFSALSLGYAMGRSHIDVEMMREVAKDLDSQTGDVDNASLIGLRAGGPMVDERRSVWPDSPRRDGWWKGHKTAMTGLAVAGLAATLLIVLGGLQYVRLRPERRLPAKTAVAVPAKPSAPSKPFQAEPSSFVATPARGTMASMATPDNLSGDEAQLSSQEKTVKVVVRPGETLQRIALRTLGQDNMELIRQIQELNPRLKNPDHIEADQEIRLPQVSPEAQRVSQ